MTGLPEHNKQHIRASCRMDKMYIMQVLACAMTILKDDRAGMELATTAAKLTRVSLTGFASAPRKCYVCDDPNI